MTILIRLKLRYPGCVFFWLCKWLAAWVAHSNVSNVVASINVGLLNFKKSCVLKNLSFDLRNSSLGHFVYQSTQKNTLMWGGGP